MQSVLNTNIASFSSDNKNNNDEIDEKTKKFIEEEKELFNNLTEKQKTFYHAMNLNLLKRYEEFQTDPTLWWNKLAQMTFEEKSMLPSHYIKKFGSFYIKLQENLQ